MSRQAELLKSCMMLLALATAAAVARPPIAAAQSRNVVINRVRLPDEQVRSLEQQYRIQLQDGAYWYDRFCGAWGLQGGPTAGFTLPGMSLGGPLRADASGGNTGVFINGRQIHIMDLAALQQLVGVVNPGRYWVDPQGNAGYEGGPAMLNLVALARSRSGQGGLWKGAGAGVGESYGGGAWAYGNSNTGIGVISDGEGGMTVFSH